MTATNVFEIGILNTGASKGTTVQASASINTKGGWVQLSTGFAHPVNMLELIINPTSNTAMHLMDLALDVSGVKTIILPNLPIAGYNNTGHRFTIPLYIPAGVAIYARNQASAASEILNVAITGWWDDTFPALQLTTVYGVSEADSGGTQVDPGGVANTEGAKIEIVASTSFPIRMLGLFCGHAGDNTRSAGGTLYRIYVGAGGSETLLVGPLSTYMSSAIDVISPIYQGPFPVEIPAGTRLAVSAASSVTAASDREYDVALLGVG